MTIKEWWFHKKRQILKKYFQDVMDVNSRIYLSYLREPTTGLKELYNISKHRMLDELERKLNNGVVDSTLFDELFEFYGNTPLYDFSGMHYELTGYVLETIGDFESNSGTLIDKENLFVLRALLQITSSNTIGAMASWELANIERQRTTGINVSIVDLINRLPEQTIVNPINYNYSNNPFVNSCITKYPALVNSDLKSIILTITGVDSISLLSSGLRNVQVTNLIQSHNNSLEINKIFAQEIVNSLCILNESIIKDYPQVATSLPRKKDRQIGKMLAPTTLNSINPNVSTILGSSVGGHSGLYLSTNIMNDTDFNTNFPIYLNNLSTNTLPIDEFKANILVGLHTLRNKVLHDYDDTLCFYSDTDLFIKTIGLLFVGVSVTKNL
jgi:hypothetical protein